MENSPNTSRYQCGEIACMGAVTGECVPANNLDVARKSILQTRSKVPKDEELPIPTKKEYFGLIKRTRESALPVCVKNETLKAALNKASEAGNRFYR